MKLQLLGGMAPARFLSRYWQKKPLLVRGAIPGFKGFLDFAGLKRLARNESVESRLVSRVGRRWRLQHGPLSPAHFRALPRTQWTVLVQGINLHVEAGDKLLRRFDFIPAARLDDLMVSYAAPGGGVGPHRDSYDVFLLQGPGRRRWRISASATAQTLPGAPLAVLENLRAEEEWILDPGDMLYLPPHYAHEGTAMEECLTYSIGFRAPSQTELARALLDRIDERLDTRSAARYADPGLKVPRHVGAIPGDLLRYARRVEGRLRLNRAEIGATLGLYLSEPKPEVSFATPARSLSPRDFATKLHARGARLDRRTRMFHHRGTLYINGESLTPTRAEFAHFRRLADTRRLASGTRIHAELLRTLQHWYACGWLHLGDPDKSDERI